MRTLAGTHTWSQWKDWKKDALTILGDFNVLTSSVLDETPSSVMKSPRDRAGPSRHSHCLSHPRLKLVTVAVTCRFPPAQHPESRRRCIVTAIELSKRVGSMPQVTAPLRRGRGALVDLPIEDAAHTSGRTAHTTSPGTHGPEPWTWRSWARIILSVTVITAHRHRPR